MERQNHNKINVGATIGTIIVLAVIIGIVIFFLTQGSTTTTGGYPENVEDKALTCTGSGIDYPIFTYDNSTRKDTEINVLFSGETMRSISLSHNLYYEDAASISGSEAHNHAAMNISFSENGLASDSFNAKYSKFGDRMRMDLFATKSDLNNTALKYFLIDVNDDFMPNKMSSFKVFYEGLGMKCEESK